MATSCGTGLGVSGPAPLPNDPIGSMTLTAIAGFGGINVRWTMPGTNAHAIAHTLLYRGTSPNFPASIQRGVVSGNSFFDQIAEAGTYYYWIRTVSINGSIGDLYGPASATIRSLSDDVLDTLTGRISDGVLATSLRATLDNISMINAKLNEEIFDREGGETSFAQALLDVSNGVAAAHSFITTAINSQVTANSAIAEQIDLVAVTLGDQVAAVVISADAWIGPHASLSGKVTDIGALWTAKVTVNGLIGGFGIYNDGSTVEAGFDVDTFWIGRSGIDKVLPFIIDGGTVYINKARIRNADIDTLKIGGRSATSVDSANGVDSANVYVYLSGVAGETYDVILMATAQQSSAGYFLLYDNGSQIASGIGQGLSSASLKITGAANTAHNYTLVANFGIQCTITALVSKR